MFGAMLEKLLTDPVHVFDEDGPGGAHVSVIAEIKAKAGHEEEVRVILHELVVAARLEPGCEAYHLLEDKKIFGQFATCEDWENVGALQRHLDGTVAKSSLEKAQPMIDGEMKLTVFRKLL